MNEVANLITSTPQATALFDKNVAWLKQNQPSLFAVGREADTSHFTLSFHDDKIDNIYMDSLPLYGTSAHQYCENQMRDFWNKPERIIFDDIQSCNASPVSKGLMEIIIEDFLDKTESLDKSTAPVTDSGFCFVFGLGLGLFLQEMIDKKVARNIVICEPVHAFFAQSLHVLDWEKLYEDAEKQGISLRFCFFSHPTEIVEYLEITIRDIGNTFIDGSYFFMHYPSWENIEAYNLFRDRIKIYFQSTGFFEDELIMVRNTYLNLLKNKFRFIKRKPYLHQDYPVFVVASGPSIEFDLDNIKKNRDRVIVVSSGTTIGLLLNNGIRPDFHAELENTKSTLEFLTFAKEKHGLQDITLMASTSVYDGVAALFDEVWFCHRSGSSSAVLFDHDMGEIAEITPLSANVATASIASLGFRNIYFLGVDCGKYTGASHHAKGTIYEDLGIDLDNFLNPQFNRIVPGNFGGQVSTSVFLDMSRRHLVGLINRLALNAYNCSHGARIDGAKPMASGSIKLTSQPGKQAFIKQQLRDQAILFEDGSYFDELDIENIPEKIDVLIDRIKIYMQKAYENETSMYDLEHSFEDFWHENYSEFKTILTMIGGTMGTMFRLAGHIYIRLNNEDQRQECLKVSIKGIEKQTLWMLDTLRDFLRAMAERQWDVPLPDAYELTSLKDKPTETA